MNNRNDLIYIRSVNYTNTFIKLNKNTLKNRKKRKFKYHFLLFYPPIDKKNEKKSQ